MPKIPPTFMNVAELIKQYPELKVMFDAAMKVFERHGIDPVMFFIMNMLCTVSHTIYEDTSKMDDEELKRVMASLGAKNPDEILKKIRSENGQKFVAETIVENVKKLIIQYFDIASKLKMSRKSCVICNKTYFSTEPEDYVHICIRCRIESGNTKS